MPDNADRGSNKKRVEAEGRRRVLQVAKGISATIGRDFFQSVVKHLATTLQADCAYVAELTDAPNSPIKPLAVDRSSGNANRRFEQQLSATAAGQVLSDGVFYCTRDARRRFPLDTLLDSLTTEGYVGVRLCDSVDQPLGLIACLFRRPLSDISLIKSVVNAFAPRLAAELERKRADDLLRDSEQRYRAFVLSNPDAMWRIELEQPMPVGLAEGEQIDWIYRFGYLGECNDAMARLLGAEYPEALAGARFSDVAPRTDARVVEQLRLTIRSGFRSDTVETILHDEHDLPVHRLRSQFGIVENGRLHRIWGTTRDITELRRAQSSLKTAEHFGQIVDSLYLPTVVLDTNGDITYSNAALSSLLRAPRQALTGRRWLDTAVPAEDRESWTALLSCEERDLPRTSIRIASNVLVQGAGRSLMVWDARVLRSGDDQVIGFAAVGRGTTGKRAQAEGDRE